MKLIKSKAEILVMREPQEILKNIERVGRTAYKSEDKITDTSAPKFVSMLAGRQHWAVLEHESITVKFTTNRGVSHEIVRHRVASFCQESTRYCNYGKQGHLNICIPSWAGDLIEGTYLDVVEHDTGWWLVDEEGNKRAISMLEATFCRQWLEAEKAYNEIIAMGKTPQLARGILPNDLKTEVVMTANLREWKHFLNLRSLGTTGAPHPDMKEVADQLQNELHDRLPEVF